MNEEGFAVADSVQGLRQEISALREQLSQLRLAYLHEKRLRIWLNQRYLEIEAAKVAEDLRSHQTGSVTGPEQPG